MNRAEWMIVGSADGLMVSKKQDDTYSIGPRPGSNPSEQSVTMLYTGPTRDVRAIEGTVSSVGDACGDVTVHLAGVGADAEIVEIPEAYRGRGGSWTADLGAAASTATRIVLTVSPVTAGDASGDCSVSLDRLLVKQGQ